jgi:hypothetical protein
LEKVGPTGAPGDRLLGTNVNIEAELADARGGGCSGEVGEHQQADGKSDSGSKGRCHGKQCSGGSGRAIWDDSPKGGLLPLRRSEACLDLVENGKIFASRQVSGLDA